MTIRPYDLWLITCEYHTRLLPMTITHDYEHHSWSITAPMTSLHHSWLSPLCVTYDCHRSLITRDDHYHPWPSSHKTITNDHHYHLPLMTMTSYSQLAPMSYHSCLIIHVLSFMSYHSCLITHVLSLMSIYDHDSWPSWLMTYNSSLVTITSDHHPWPSFMIIRSDHLTSHPWLLTHGY